MFRFIKRFLDRFPLLAFAYRAVRDERKRRSQSAKSTQHGFKIAGSLAIQAGTFEPEETALIKKFLGETEVFVDIGANIGFYTCLARSAGKYAIAFEPLTQNLDYLYANLRENGWEDTEILPVGLSDKPGVAVLYGGSTGASLVDGWANSSPLLKRSIALSTLDIILGNRFAGKKLLVKMDVEGAEYDVLKGAGNILSMTPSPIWLAEICFAENNPSGINPHYADIFELFFQHGYVAHTANQEMTRVLPDDVARWVKQGACDSGAYNYLFMRDASC